MSASLSSPPVLSANSQPLHVDGQYGHVGPSSNTQEHVTRLGQVHEQAPPVPSPLAPSPSVPPYYSTEQSNNNWNTSEEDNRFMIWSFGDS